MAGYRRLDNFESEKRAELRAEIARLEMELEAIEAKRMLVGSCPHLRRQADALYYKLESRQALLKGYKSYSGPEHPYIGYK